MTVEFLIIILALIFGTIIGSFLNVVIWRLPRKGNLRGRSQCPHCSAILSGKDLIPILSYLFAKGKCRYCKHKISSRYWVVELITGVLFACVVAWFLPSDYLEWLQILSLWSIISILIVVFIIDLEHFLILDKVLVAGGLLVVGARLLSELATFGWQINWWLWVDMGIGAIAGFLPFYILWLLSRGRLIGLGDAKFGILLGVIFGWPQVYIVYFVAFLLGTIYSIPLLLTGKKQLTSKLPFGTFLAVAAVIMIFVGLDLLHWYLGLIMG